VKHQAKHFFYAAGWKKFEPLWDLVIRAKQLAWMTPMLEAVLSRVTGERARHFSPTADLFPILSGETAASAPGVQRP
jgi:hypothetical protein